MKRFTLSLLVFAAVAFTTVGCKRSSEENKRKPLRVTVATDYINPQAIDETAVAFPKKDKNAPLPGKVEEQAARDRNAKMLANIATTYNSYFETRTLSELTEDDFKLRLTRDAFRKERKAVEGDVIKIVLVADKDFPDHVIAWTAEAEQNEHQAAFVSQKVDKIKGGDLDSRWQRQAVQCVYSQFKAYVAQGQPRGFEEFRAYLRQNASPTVAKLVAGQEIRVNMNAQVGNGSSILACYKAANANLGGSPKTVTGVMGNGEFKALEPDAVQQVFAK